MKRALFLLPLLLLISCATVGPSVPAAARAEFAPTGKLRVGLIAVSPIFVTQNTPPGVTRGIAVDIAGQLAGRLGVAVELVRYPNERAMMDAAGKDEWDIIFSGINPARADVVNFTAPYMYVEDAPIGMGVQKRRPAALAYAFEFIEQIKASGAIQDAISREALAGARAAR
jgi:ABC-type amino acid transport substrate-binding protein